MPIKIGRARAGISKKPWGVFYESKVPTVAFLERIKVYDIKLADVNGSGTDIGIGLWRQEKVLPTPLQDAHTWPIVPT
jgi:hypothetical protein